MLARVVRLLGIGAAGLGGAGLVLALAAPASLASEAEWRRAMDAAGRAQRQGVRADAERAALEAVRAAEEFGPTDARLASSLHLLAETQESQGRYAEAGTLYQRALAIRETAHGGEDPRVAATPSLVGPLSSLALLYRRLGRLAEAESLARRALAVREQASGPDHPALAAPLNLLASILLRDRRYAEAEPLLRRAGAIYEAPSAQVPENHPRHAEVLENLALVLRGLGRKAEAAQAEAQAAILRTRW
jgi:tetratricopeptide (TPR) repeat protein